MQRSVRVKSVNEAESPFSRARRSATRCCAAGVMAGRRPFGGSTINDAWRCGADRSNQCCGGDCPPPTSTEGDARVLEVEVGDVLILLAFGLRLAVGEFRIVERVARAE